MILEVSGTNLVGATHHQAVDVLRSCPQLAHLTVQRGPATVVRVRSPAIDNHGSHVAWQTRTVTSPPSNLGSLSEEGRPESAGEMGAVAAAMRCSEFAAKSCSSPSPRKHGSDYSHASPTRVLQNVILCSPTNEKGSSMPWTLPRSYSNGEADVNRDIMALQKGSIGRALSPADENPYKTTIRVSPRKNSSPSLPILAEQHNVVARPRRNSSDAWSTKVVVSNNAPDVIRLHVSFANKNAVNANSQSCYQLQNGGHYSPSLQLQNGDYPNGDLLQRQISSSSDTSQRMDNATRACRTVSPSISCSSKFSSSCSSLNDETPSSSRSPTPQLTSVSSERRLSGSIGYVTSRDTSLSSECHSDDVGNRNENSSMARCDASDNAAHNSRRNSCHHLPSPLVKNGGTVELPNTFTANATKRASLNGDNFYGNVVRRSVSSDAPIATSTATKPKAAVLRLNSMSRCGSYLQQRRRRSSACAVSPNVDISVSDWEAENNGKLNDNAESDEEDSWETLLLEEFPFISEDNIFEVCMEKNSRGLGLSVCGGWDSAPADPFARLIRIKRLYPLQPAADSGLLEIGDILLTVNGTPLTGRMYFEAIEILRMAPTEVYLFVCRPEPGILPSIPQNTSLSGSGMLSSSSLDMTDSISTSRYNGPMYSEIDVTLTKVGGSLGFSLVKLDNPDGEESGGGHYIKALVKEPALSDGRLQPGDKIILVNGTDISEMNHAEAIRFLRELPDEVTLCLWREVSSCPLSPLSPLSPSSPQPEEATRKKRSKPLLRKEALDMLSDKARQKANCTSPSPRSSPRIKGVRPAAAGDDAPAPVHHATTLTRTTRGCNTAIVPDATALNLERSRRDRPPPSDDVSDVVSPSLPPLSPSPPPSPTSDDHIELRFADDSPESNSSDLQNGYEDRIRHKPKRFHSEPVAVPTTRPPPADPNDLPSMAGSFSCSESSSCSKPTHSPARPSFLDLTPGNLSPRKQLYGRGVVMAPTHRVPPPASSAATTSSPSAVLTDDSDSSLRYLDSGDSLLATEDDPLTTVTSSEDSPLAITLGNSALLKWRGATLASQENLSCEEPKPDNSSQLQEQGSKASLMTVELDRGCYSRLGFSVVAIETEASTGIYIKIVYPNSVAEGLLQAGDKLLKINETSVSGLSAGDVILLLRKSSGKIIVVIERCPDNFECSHPEMPRETANSTSGISDNSGSLTRSQSQHEELLSNEVSSLNAKNNNISRCFRWDTRPSFQDENENFAGRSHHRVNM